METMTVGVGVALEWQDAFRVWLEGSGRRGKTIEAYLQDIRHFSRFFEQVNGGQPFSPELLNASDVRAYFRQQDDDHAVAPASRNRRLASLRVLVNWAVEAGLLEYDPTVSIKRVEVDGQPRDKSRAEMERLEAALGIHTRARTPKHQWLAARDAVIWALMADAGLRVSEVAGLDLGDLDLEHQSIRVLGKGGKKATVMIGSALVERLRAWLEMRPANAGAAVVCRWGGQRLTPGQVRRRIKMVGAAAGVNVRPHDLRHTYVYRLLDAMLTQGLHAPVALDAVRRQARHSDSRTTMMYLRAREEHIRAAVEAMC